MTIQKILVGVDFSSQSDAALTQAVEIARHTGAEITLLHCGAVPDEPVVPDSMQRTAQAYVEILQEHLAKDREKLHEIRNHYEGQGVNVSHMVIDGFADSKIPEAAKELGVDLVVVGTHGRTGAKRFFLGSVAERTTRLTETSVLVVREGDDTGRGGYKKILVPTDFSQTSEKALQTAIALAGPGSHITVLHCWQVPPLTTATYAPVKAAQDMYVPIRDSLSANAEQTGEELLSKAAADGIDFDFRHVEAPPAEGIQKWLEDNDCGLVVMGSHGRRGLRRFLLGSVAEVTVRHSNCSVLVVHPGSTV